MANNWQINVIAGLDGAQSKNQLNSDIKELAKNLDKLKLYAEIDKNQVIQLQNQLKKLQIDLNTVTVSDAAINGIVQKINNGLKNIQINNINLGNVNSQVKQAGQEAGKQFAQSVIDNIDKGSKQMESQAKQTGLHIGQQINEGVNETLNKNSKALETFKQSLKNMEWDDTTISNVSKEIETLDVKITSLKQSVSEIQNKKGTKKLLNVEVSGIDKAGQAITFTKTWDIESEKLVKSLGKVSNASKKSGTEAEAFAKKQKASAANLLNQINQLNAGATDKSANKPIADEKNLGDLSNRYNEIIASIEKMKVASKDAFDEEEINVKKLINDYKIAVSGYRNAENVSIKMKSTDYKSGKDIVGNNLETLKQDAEGIPQMTKTISDLEDAFKNITDASGLNKFTDQLRVARSELTKFKAETQATTRQKKLSIDKDALRSKVLGFKNANPGTETFEATIDEEKVLIESLLKDIDNINNRPDLSVITHKFQAFESAARAAGLVVKEVNSETLGMQATKAQENVASGKYEADVQAKIAQAKQWVNANGETAVSTNNLSEALKNLQTAYNNLNTNNSVANQEALVSAEKTLNSELAKTTNEIKKQKAEFAKTADVQSLYQRYKETYDKNSAMHPRYGKDMRAAMEELKNPDKITNERYAQLNKNLKDYVNNSRASGKLGLSFFDKIKDQASRFSSWMSTTTIIMRAARGIKQIAANTIELDEALTNISYTMDASETQLKRIGETSIKTANELHTSTSKVLNAVKTYANAKETTDKILNKAKPTIMMSNVSGMDVQSTVDIIQGAVEQFQLDDTEEQLMNISDLFQTVSANMPMDFSKNFAA